MTDSHATNLFRQIMRERREFVRGTLDHDWRTKAARKYVWLIRKIPTNEWDMK